MIDGTALAPLDTWRRIRSRAARWSSASVVRMAYSHAGFYCVLLIKASEFRLNVHEYASRTILYQYRVDATGAEIRSASERKPIDDAGVIGAVCTVARSVAEMFTAEPPVAHKEMGALHCYGFRVHQAFDELCWMVLTSDGTLAGISGGGQRYVPVEMRMSPVLGRYYSRWRDAKGVELSVVSMSVGPRSVTPEWALFE